MADGDRHADAVGRRTKTAANREDSMIDGLRIRLAKRLYRMIMPTEAHREEKREERSRKAEEIVQRMYLELFEAVIRGATDKETADTKDFKVDEELE